MKIDIFDDMSFFSHRPGAAVIVPHTEISVIVFPSRLIIEGDIYDFSLVGPVAQFTVFQDPKKGKVEVSGFSKRGFFRYEIFGKEGKLIVLFRSLPSATECLSKEGSRTVNMGSSIERPLANISQPNPEMLSLGLCKKKDFEMAGRRLDMREILPYWFYLGQNIPGGEDLEEGTAILLADCEKAIAKRDKLVIEELFTKVFLTSFSSIFYPRLEDLDHNGILEAVRSPASPLVILRKGSKLIRSLFFEEGARLSILPCLPPGFHSGRFLNLSFSFGTIDLEWSKKTVRKVILKAVKSGPVLFDFAKDAASFRLRTSLKGKGEFVSKESELGVEEGKIYYLDRFRKYAEPA